MTATVTFLRLAVLASVVALGLAGCGRKSGLDAPPDANAPAKAATAQPQSPTDVFGVVPAEQKPAAATDGPKRRIILDGLLN